MANPYEKHLTFEDREHIRVVNYIKDKLHEVIAFHVPNEGLKSPFERYKHSLMGALKGCPDFVFLHPKFKPNEPIQVLYHGLTIELKVQEHKRIVMKGKDAGKIVKTKGVLSKEQAEVLERLNKNGYKALCCFGSDEAIAVINDYFKEYLEEQRLLNKNKFKIK